MKIKNYKIKNCPKGFTLTEVLIYIAVLGFIMVVVAVFVLWTSRAASKAKASREALDSAKRAIDTIINEVKEARSIYLPTTNQNQLSLETQRYLPQGETYTYIDFYLCGDRVCLKRELQPATTLTSADVAVRSLNFTRILNKTAESVQVILRAEYKAGPQTKGEFKKSIDLQSVGTLRNL